MRLSAYSVILSVLYVALSASLTFSEGGLSKFLAVFLMAIVYTVIVIDVMSVRRHEAGTFMSVGDVCYAVFALTFGRIAGKQVAMR